MTKPTDDKLGPSSNAHDAAMWPIRRAVLPIFSELAYSMEYNRELVTSLASTEGVTASARTCSALLLCLSLTFYRVMQHACNKLREETRHDDVMNAI